MRLIPNAGKVARGASSMWLIYGAGALEIGEQVIPHLADFLPWYVKVGVLAAAGVARLVKQEGLHHD